MATVRYIKADQKSINQTRQKAHYYININQDTCAFAKNDGGTTILLTSGGVFMRRGGVLIIQSTEGPEGRVSIISPSKRKKENKIEQSTHQSSEELRDLCHVKEPPGQVHGLATSPCPYALRLWHPRVPVDTPASAYDFSALPRYSEGA